MMILSSLKFTVQNYRERNPKVKTVQCRHKIELSNLIDQLWGIPVSTKYFGREL